MKILLPIFGWLWPVLACSQAKSLAVKDTVKVQPKTITVYKPEILTSGFIDIISNGQVNASARFLRLFIGEPGKFSFPLSIYSGVSNNNLQNTQGVLVQRGNEQLLNNFINPLSGLVNISADGIVFFNKDPVKLTRSGFLYHGGLRILTGNKILQPGNTNTGKPVNFISSFGAGGLYFQTGAWERANTRNMGVFWLAARYIGSKTGERQLREILIPPLYNGFYHGWSLAGGVEINNLVNIKVICYRYVQAPAAEYTLPIYQFSFNYSLR